MPEPFQFATAGEIHFGRGTVGRSGVLASKWGRRAFVVTGRDSRRAAPLVASLETSGVESILFGVRGEPNLLQISEGVREARRSAADLVVGFGGGSAIDAAKAIAGLLTNPGELTDYLEVVGEGKALKHPAMPWIAVPTTAGTGAEVTRNAVLSVPERALKVSLRSPHLFARVAIVDPELTRGLPGEVAAATAMDALTQLIESYLSLRANPLTDALCESGIPRALRAIDALASGNLSDNARAELSWAALASGMALTNSGLGAVHGLAGPIGGGSEARHGSICAVLLSPVLAQNAAALRARLPDSPTLGRLDRVASWITGSASSSPDEAAERIRTLVSRLGIRTLGGQGVKESDLRRYAEAGLNASSMKGNPVRLTVEELIDVMQRSL